MQITVLINDYVLLSYDNQNTLLNDSILTTTNEENYLIKLKQKYEYDNIDLLNINVGSIKSLKKGYGKTIINNKEFTLSIIIKDKKDQNFMTVLEHKVTLQITDKVYSFCEDIIGVDDPIIKKIYFDYFKYKSPSPLRITAIEFNYK